MPELFQIRRGYRAAWRDLAFSVEGVASQWTLSVQRAGDNRPLYRAERCGVGAARAAAVEFGVFCELGPASPVVPSQLAAELSWQEYY